MDADDVAHPARLALQAERLERDAQVDVLGCRAQAFAGGERIHGVPVVPVEAATACRGALHLAAVGVAGARERIRAEASRLGLVDETDLIAVA
jgi:hypothetical protein